MLEQFANKVVEKNKFDPTTILVIMQVVMAFVQNCPMSKVMDGSRRPGPFAKARLLLLVHRHSNLSNDECKDVSRAILDEAQNISDEEFAELYNECHWR